MCERKIVTLFRPAFVLVSICFCLHLSLYASPSFSAGVFPSYTGEVTKISEPVILRYMPLSEVSYTKSMTVNEGVDAKNHEQSLKSILSGVISASGNAQTITFNLEISDIQIIENGKSKNLQNTSADLPIQLFIKMTPIGIVQSIYGNAPGSLTTLTEVTKTLNMLFPFPQKGVQQGDDVFSQLTNGNPFSESLGLPYAKGIVKGLTSYRGRPSILVDIDVTNKSKQMGIDFSGYLIIDIETGIITYSTISGTAKVTDELLSITEKQEITLPERWAPKAVPNQSKTIEERLRRIQSMLNEGLISDKEASEKRRKILNDL